MKTLNAFIFIITTFFISVWLFMFFSRKLRYMKLFPIENLANLRYIQLLFLTSFFLLIIFVCVIIYKMFKKKQKNGYFAEFLKKTNQILTKVNIFYKSYVMLFEFFGIERTEYLIKLTKFVLDTPNKIIFVITFCFVCLPRLIILIIFVIEISLGQLHYFFYGLFLLIIPLIFRVILFVLTDLGPRLFPEFDTLVKKNTKTMFITTKDGVKEQIITEIGFIDSLSDACFDTFAERVYYPLMHIEKYMKNYFLPKYIKIIQYSGLVYYFIISSGLFYVLYFNYI
jgi:hypothetical protein